MDFSLLILGRAHAGPTGLKALALTALILAAGCGTRPPAPIEHRADQAMRGAAGARPAPAPASAPPVVVAPAPAAPAEPVVQTTPVRPTAPLETRPLDPRAADPRATDPRAMDPRAAAAAAAPVKSHPRGTKLPYSDTALAEMAKAEAAAPRQTEPRPAEPRAADAKPSDTKTPDSKSADAKTGDAKGADARNADRAAAGGARVSESGWAWPADGKLLQSFDDGRNNGIAIGGRVGDPVAAAADGRVIFSGAYRGYGNLVVIKHPGDVLSVYAHNRALSVKEGDAVRRGQKIAEIGDTGTDRVKLHFEIRRQGKPVDPLKLLPAR